MQDEIRANPLGTERIGKLVMRFSVPSIIALIVNAVYNMVDQIFIGQAVGYLGNAATNVILPLVTILIAMGVMLSDGTASFMSLQLGAGEEKKASHGVGNCITLMVIIGVVTCVLFEIFLESLCWLFGTTENVLPYALEYGRIIVLGFPIAMVDFALSSVIRADGRPKASMAGMLIGCFSNIILDAVFVMVFHWGAAGAAWATIIGQALNAIFYIFLLFHFKTVHLKKEYFRLKGKIVAKVVTLGIPSFVTQIATVLIMFVMNNMLTRMGEVSKYGADIPLAVMGITMKLCTIVAAFALGIATGSQPIWGFNYGNKQYGRVKSTFKVALASSTIILVVAFFVFEFFPQQIVNLFGQESELYMEFAVKCVRTYLFGCFMVGAGLVSCIFFQSVGRSVPSTLLSFIRQIILLIPAILILGFTSGIDGILFAGPFSDILSGVLSLATVAFYWQRIFPAKNDAVLPVEEDEEPTFVESAASPERVSGKVQIITIGRQCGSGGHTIGKEVATRLGIPFYDKALIKEIASRSGLSERTVLEVGEYQENRSLFRPGGSFHGYDLSKKEGMPLSDQINAYQTELIRELANKGPCVIVGRCADYILRGKRDCLHVFIHGKPEDRVDRVIKEHRVPKNEAVQHVKDRDSKRAYYYENVTGHHWGDSVNYNLSLDSSYLSIEECVELILKHC